MLSIIGALLFLLAWIWLTIIAFTRGGVLWGLIVLVFNWIGGLIFVLVQKEGGWFQIALMGLAAVMIYFGAVRGADYSNLPPDVIPPSPPPWLAVVA